MAKRSSKPADETVDLPVEGQEAGTGVRDELTERPETKLPKSDTVKLRLTTNAMLGLEGVFTPKGTEKEFPRAEAERLLKKTSMWEKV